MNVHHTTGVLFYFNPADQKFWARRFKRTGPKFPADANFEKDKEVTGSFGFTLEMLKKAPPVNPGVVPNDEVVELDEGELVFGASGWGDVYNPPVEIELGTEASVEKYAPGLDNWGARGLARRKVDIQFSKPNAGGNGLLTWSIVGGTDSGKISFPTPPGGGKSYGVLVTLRFEKSGKAKLKLDAQSPWKSDEVDHP